jgi:elongation factor Ts
MQGGDLALARDVAMHIAASRPRWLDSEQVPPSFLQREKDVFQAQAATSGKPEAIVAKMIEGRLRKAIEEVTLVGQPFVKNPDQTVGDLLKARGARVLAFARFEVAEEEEEQAA